MKLQRNLLLMTVMSMLVIGCGMFSKKDDEDEGEASVAASNPSSAAYPTSLAITAFPTSVATTSLLGEVPSTPAAKNDEDKKILKGEATSCVPGIFAEDDKDATTETCYEFDQDMIYGLKTTQMGTLNGKNSKGSACVPAFARANIKRMESQVDRALGLVKAALCQRKKDGQQDPPAVGAEINLVDFIKKAFGDKMTDVSSAKIARKADNSDGTAVYTSAIKVTRKDGVGMDINIVHSPKNADNSVFKGVMYFTSDETKSGSAVSMKRVTTIQYEKLSDGNGRYNLRTARVNSTLLSSAINADGVLDFNAGATFTGSAGDVSYGAYTGLSANDAMSGMAIVGFAGSFTTGQGTFTYWQNPGGNYHERARGMIAQNTYDAATKTLSGCAMMGAAGSSGNDGISIRKSIRESGKELFANGAYHPFFHTETDNTCAAASGPSTDTTGTFYTRVCGSETRKWYVPKDSGANGTTFVTQQQPAFNIRTCFKQNATSGDYEIDTANTSGAAGFDLVATSDTSKKLSPPTPPSVDVKKVALAD